MKKRVRSRNPESLKPNHPSRLVTPCAPINVALPNTTEIKMQAILATAEALKTLAKAIDGTNIQITLSNNLVHCHGNQPAFNIKTL